MKEDWIPIMKTSKRLKLSFGDNLNHYFIVLFLLFIPGLMLHSSYQMFITHTYTGNIKGKDLFEIGFPFFILAIILFVVQRRELRFKELKIKTTFEHFEEAFNRTARQLEWNIEKCNTHFARAHRPWNWTSSGGEMITIIRNENLILINSICDPNAFSSSATTFGWNKKNINAFISNLNDVIKGIPEPIIEEEELPANEWTLKRTLVRLIIYPFCLFLIGLGFYIIIHPTNYKSVSASIGGIVLASFYLYLDLKILFTKKSKQT